MRVTRAVAMCSSNDRNMPLKKLIFFYAAMARCCDMCGGKQQKAGAANMLRPSCKVVVCGADYLPASPSFAAMRWAASTVYFSASAALSSSCSTSEGALPSVASGVTP